MRRAALLFVVAAGCGPISYLGESHRAEGAIEAARAAKADKLAPYWWTRAVEYLQQARTIAAHADFQGATRFGRLATDAATHAESEAILVAKDPARGPIDAHPEQ